MQNEISLLLYNNNNNKQLHFFLFCINYLYFSILGYFWRKLIIMIIQYRIKHLPFYIKDKQNGSFLEQHDGILSIRIKTHVLRVI